MSETGTPKNITKKIDPEKIISDVLNKFPESHPIGFPEHNFHLWIDLLRSIRNKKILDIGCGSKTSENIGKSSTGSNITYEPWLCRFLSEAGAKPTGIDIEKSSDEPFTYIQHDITDLSFIDRLENDSFDGINITNLFGIQSETGASPKFLASIRAKGLRHDTFKEQLITSLIPKLRNNGFLVVGNDVYRKQSDQLIKV